MLKVPKQLLLALAAVTLSSALAAQEPNRLLK
jgi:hypothetical protein